MPASFFFPTKLHFIVNTARGFSLKNIQKTLFNENKDNSGEKACRKGHEKAKARQPEADNGGTPSPGHDKRGEAQILPRPSLPVLII